jgi:hypothetical protein
MPRIPTVCAAALIGLAAAAAPASAVTVHPTDGTAPFAASGGAVTFSMLPSSWQATGATYNGETSSPPDQSLNTHPALTGVTATVCGVTGPASVTVGPPVGGST